MQGIWRFLSDSSNQRTLGFIGTALAALAGAAWAVFTYFNPAPAVSADEIELSMERQLEMILMYQEQAEARLKEKLAKDPENSGRVKDAESVYAKEVSQLRARLADQDKALAGLKETLAKVSLLLTAAPEELAPSAIERANEQIRRGKAGAAEKLLETIVATTAADSAQAEFLLGKLAEDRADLEKAAGHFRRAVLQDPGNREYREYENRLYNVSIVYDFEANDRLRSITDALAAAGLQVGTERWRDYREDGDGPLAAWVGRPTFIYSAATDASKIAELEQALAKAGIELKAGHVHGALHRRGTDWYFPTFTISLWLPGLD